MQWANCFQAVAMDEQRKTVKLQCATVELQCQKSCFLRVARDTVCHIGPSAPAFKPMGPKKIKKKNLGILFNFWWNIWKERNRRFFYHKEASVSHLASQIVEEVNILVVALPSLTSV
jgi:hypothetical protein